MMSCHGRIAQDARLEVIGHLNSMHITHLFLGGVVSFRHLIFKRITTCFLLLGV